MYTCYWCDKPFNTYEGNTAIHFQKDIESPKKTVPLCGGCCNKIMHCAMCYNNGVYHYYPKANMQCNKWDNTSCCPEHWDKNPSYKKIISYTQKAEKYLGFIGEPLDSLYIGVEIETEVLSTIPLAKFNDIKDIVYDLFDNFIIMKTDGSLSKYGIEIVSAPAPFDVHATAWNKFLAGQPEALRSNCYVSGHATSCGMHTHVSRKALTVLEIGKVAYFINAIDNKQLITDIAGRYNQQYCYISPQTKDSYKTYNLRTGKNGPEERRYNAVNTTNDNTIELRIFKGTLNPILFMKNIEFTHAVVKFCQVVDIEQLTTKEFCTFVGINAGIYPNLVKFLVYKDHLGGVKEPDVTFKQK